MSSQINSKLNPLAETLTSLHVPGEPLLLANVYDAPTAEIVASNPATKAVATASYAVAATQGIADDDMNFEQNLAGIRNVVAGLRNAKKADQIPLTADLQDGYADIGETIRRAIEAGVVGANIEDLDISVSPPRLRSPEEAASRIEAAVAAAKEAGVPGFAINARTDVLGYGGTIQDCIDRGKKYLEKGAVTVFIWGCGKKVITQEEVKELCKGLGGRISVQGPGPTPLSVQELREAGVSRISMGPWFFRKATKAFGDEADVFLKS